MHRKIGEAKVSKARLRGAKVNETKVDEAKAREAEIKAAEIRDAKVSEPTLQGPTGCSSFKLRQLSRRVSQQFDRVIGTAGLKTTQYSLLSHVAQLGPVRPGDLAAAMEMDASTLTRNLQPLVGKGWLAVGPGEDGRSRFVRLTAAGREKRAEAQRQWKRAQLVFNARIGAERVARLHALIDDCLALINETEGDAAAST